MLLILAAMSTVLLAVGTAGLLLWRRHHRAHWSRRRTPEYQPSRAARRIVATRAYERGDTEATEIIRRPDLQ